MLYEVITGLPAAIKTFINRINNVADIKFQYKIHLAGRLKPELEITIYRLVCEFINNSLKHSKANTIQLEITNEEYLKITCRITSYNVCYTKLLRVFSILSLSSPLPSSDISIYILLPEL